MSTNGLAEHIRHEEIRKGLVNNALEALSGQTAGVNVTTNGTDRMAMLNSVRVRGTTSITGGNDPLVIIDGVTDTTNIGAIFRSAAALGIDAVLLTRTACDPLNRRAVRVSMGSVFLVPWTWIDDIEREMHAEGFATAAMALTDDSISIDDPVLKTTPKLAIIMGTEGDGLAHEVITAADYVVRIPMAHGVDSLNVAAAAAVAFWELRQR